MNRTTNHRCIFTIQCREMISELCLTIELHTRNQSKDSSWHQVRYGCITVSIFYAAANCQTVKLSNCQTVKLSNC